MSPQPHQWYPHLVCLSLLDFPGEGPSSRLALRDWNRASCSVGEHDRDRLLRELVNAPCLEISKARLGGAWSGRRCAYPWQGVGSG